MTYNNSIAYCVSKNSYLVNIKSESEFYFIQNYLKNQSIQYSVWVKFKTSFPQGCIKQFFYFKGRNICKFLEFLLLD